jgi:hypothetical protein
VHTEFVEHANPAFAVPEYHESFAKQFRAQRIAIWFRQLRRRRHGMPVPAHELANIRAGSDTY